MKKKVKVVERSTGKTRDEALEDLKDALYWMEERQNIRGGVIMKCDITSWSHAGYRFAAKELNETNPEFSDVQVE